MGEPRSDRMLHCNQSPRIRITTESPRDFPESRSDFASQPGDAQAKSPPVYPDGLAQRVVAVENSAKFKGKYRGIAEARAYHASMLNCGFLVKLSGCVVKFAHDHGEFTTGIAQNRSSIDSLNAL